MCEGKEDVAKFVTRYRQVMIRVESYLLVFHPMLQLLYVFANNISIQAHFRFGYSVIDCWVGKGIDRRRLA